MAFQVIVDEADFEAKFAVIKAKMDTTPNMDEKGKKEFAEEARMMHASVAWSENGTIAWGRGNYYQRSLQVFLRAITAAYPKSDSWLIYEMWVDCSEEVAYCAEYLKEDIQRKLNNKNNCHIWHKNCTPDDCCMPGQRPQGDKMYLDGYYD